MTSRRTSLSPDHDLVDLTVYTPGNSGRTRGGKDKEVFACDHPNCGQTYSRLEYLRRHQRKHQDDRPFQCKDCTKAFARSDVLLRHRRRCHPTPPPADRESDSPIPAQRAPYGVPISDAREMSPQIEGRKHPRQTSATKYDQASQRLRLEDVDNDDGIADVKYDGGRNSSTDIHGMYGLAGQNGPFYGLNGGADALPEGSTYTPHLLPAFHHNAPYHNMNNPDHLEDASVLLSMAYPTNFPEPGPGEDGAADGQRSGEIPAWAPGQNLNMLMEQGTSADSSLSGPNSAGAVSDALGGLGTNDTAASTGQTLAGVAATETAGEQTYAQAMNWLGAMANSGSHPNSAEGAIAPWLVPQTTTDAGPAAFSLSAMFSPNTMSLLNLAPTPRAEEDEGPDTESNNQLMNVLNQFTNGNGRSNPNPERPLLRIRYSQRVSNMGEYVSIGRDNRFYLPSDRFMGCYEIPHWAIPPLRTMSVMASRTFHSVLSHLSFVHQPTFRLIDTAACLAFAICTVSGIRPASNSVKFYNMLAKRPQVEMISTGLDGPVPPGRSWEQMSSDGFGFYEEGGDDDRILATQEDEKKISQWQTAAVVRNEKTNMLVKSFSLAKGVLMTEYNVSLLQSLILYYAPSFLSEDESERQMANMFMGTIVTIARQIGLYSQDLEHFEATIPLPSEPYTPNELNLYWRRWIQLEVRRRTAFLILHLDTVSSLESSQSCLLNPSELAELLLPAPDSMWKAPNAEAWLAAAKKYRPLTLDEAMRRSFFLPSFGPFDALHEKADTKYYNLLNESVLGAFARVSMVLCLLRGIMDIGEGKRDRGDWRDLTDLWVSCAWLKPGKKCLDAQGDDMGAVSREGLRERFAEALRKWREGWDFDPTCPSPSAGVNAGASPKITKAQSASLNGSGGLSSGSDTTPSSASNGSPKEEEAGPILNYCEEALPYYWLASALLSILQTTSAHEPGWNTFGKDGSINYSDMLKTARTFTRLGEGLGASAVTSNTHGSAPSSTAPHSVENQANLGNPPIGGGGGLGAGQVDMAGLLDPSLLTPGGGLDLSALGTEWLSGTGLGGQVNGMIAADYQALL